MPASIVKEVTQWGRLVKFSHTIFAMPFALSMFVIVARDYPVKAQQLVAILVCLVSARTAAMGFNRLVDAEIDARNPRTQTRELPQGLVKRSSVILLCVLSIIVFHVGAAVLGTHCLILAPLVIGWLLFYSWTKRFTSLSHLVLGASLAFAPGGVWYALQGTFALFPGLLMIAVLFWVAGFDLLYSCQDYEFDKKAGLHSIPVKIGIKNTMILARVFHLITFLFLALFGLFAHCRWFYAGGLGVFGMMLISQHRLVSPNDLSKIDLAFFTRNGVASVMFFLGVLADSVWLA